MFEALGRKKYGVILADPPWRFTTYNEDISAKSAAAHYDLLDLDAIKRMPVHDLAAPDCALICWGTQAQSRDLHDVVEAWGFQPKSLGAWLKLSKTGNKLAFGTGYIYRSTVEFFLFATRGSPKSEVKNIRNAIIAPVREHSRKPDEMYDVIDEMFPIEQKLELFARGSRQNWDSWGNQVDKFAPALSEVDETGI